jgi:hypothetical protein
VAYVHPLGFAKTLAKAALAKPVAKGTSTKSSAWEMTLFSHFQGHLSHGVSGCFFCLSHSFATAALNCARFCLQRPKALIYKRKTTR